MRKSSHQVESGAGELPVAVTGMGCMAGAGVSVDDLWNNLNNKMVGAAPVPGWLFKTILHYPVFAAPRQGLSPAAQELINTVCADFDPQSVSRTILLALSAVAEAIKQAGINPNDLCGRRVGIAMGTTVGCTFHNEEYFVAWREGRNPQLSPVQYYLGGNLAAALHRILGTKGPLAVITNACASGTDAIGIGRDWIATNQCDLAIAGGADELSRVAYNGFVSLMLADTTACRPFNADRRGLNLGEGAGVVILEAEENAAKRGISPLGWVRGYGSAADAYHPTAPHPEGRGLKNALAGALADAGGAAPICFVNAHGTGTKANDMAETCALAATFPDAEKLTVVSTKGITGHTLGAAGGIEAVFTLLALRTGRTPGTVGCSELDADFPLKPLTQDESRDLPSRWGISQSLAFGGGNSVLVLEGAS